MGVMSRIEAAMQGAVEGAFGRVFRTRVEPAELARKMERAMDTNLTLEIDRRVAPNVYDLFLSPQDMAYLGPNAGVWTTSIANGLIATARDRGYLMTTNPVVRLYEDSALGTGQTRVEAHLMDTATMARQGIEVASAAADETRAINAAEGAALAQELANAKARAASTSIPPAWLTLIRPGRGQPKRIERQTVHIGRNTDNEFVVPDKRVSRFHAEIRCENGQFYLYDLGSTNGVLVNGARATRPTPLKNNDVVTVGSHEFVFQRR
jgi:predicted component of type VI protein secretion system